MLRCGSGPCCSASRWTWTPRAAKRAVRSCDAFLAVGTSGSVSPVSGLLRYANDVGALTVLVNPAPGVGRGFEEHLRMTADAALPLILAPA